MEVSKASPYNYGHNLGGDMEAVRRYVSSRYPRLLDYSAYHCSIAGMADEAADVLDEVILDLLQKDEQKVIRMMTSRKGKYTELDFYVLRMINLSVHSATSPYQSRYRSIPVNDNVNFQRLKIIDDPDEEPDRAGLILKRMRLIRWVFDGLDLSDLERRVFEYKFFEQESFLQWSGPEKTKQLYPIYEQIIGAIHGVLYYQGLTKVKPRNYKLTGPQMDRQMEIILQFRRKRRITIKHTNDYSQ